MGHQFGNIGFFNQLGTTEQVVPTVMHRRKVLHFEFKAMFFYHLKRQKSIHNYQINYIKNVFQINIFEYMNSIRNKSLSSLRSMKK